MVELYWTVAAVLWAIAILRQGAARPQSVLVVAELPPDRASSTML